MVRRCPGQLAQRTGGEDGIPSFLPTLPSLSLFKNLALQFHLFFPFIFI